MNIADLTPTADFGIALIMLSVVSMAVLHVTARQISPVERTMSEYAIVGLSQRIIFGVCVLSISAAAVMLIFLSLDHLVAVVALSFAALGMATTAFAITDDLDPEGEPKSSVHGAIHNVGALLAFLGTIVAAIALIPTFANTDVGIIVGALPLLGTLFFLGTFAFRESRIRAGRQSIHGIGERVALATVWLWFLLAFFSGV